MTAGDLANCSVLSAVIDRRYSGRARHHALFVQSPSYCILILHETIDCRPPEIRIADAGEVGGGDPGAIVSCAHAELVPIERLDNLGSQTRLEMFDVCVGTAQIAEDISVSTCCTKGGQNKNTLSKKNTKLWIPRLPDMEA